MARDLETARAVVRVVVDQLMATELGEVQVEVNAYEFRLNEAVNEVADLLDPDEAMDVEITDAEMEPPVTPLAVWGDWEDVASVLLERSPDPDDT